METSEQTKKCWCCGKPMTRLVRLIRTKEVRGITQNTTEVCTNRKCVKYLDISKIPTWKVYEK